MECLQRLIEKAGIRQFRQKFSGKYFYGADLCKFMIKVTYFIHSNTAASAVLVYELAYVFFLG